MNPDNRLRPVEQAPGRRNTPAQDRWTVPGMAFFVTALLVALSAFPSGRLEIAGLLVHPYLIPVALLVPVTLLPRIHFLPRPMIVWFLLFLLFYAVSTLLEPSTDWQSVHGELLKITAFVVTIVVSALALRSDTDLVAVVIALSLAVSAMCLRGLLGEESEHLGINAMEGIANKNAFSMYVLPVMLLSGYLLLSGRVSIRTKIVLGLGAATMAVAVFASANRSGYVGVLLIVVMLASLGRSVRKIATLGILAALTYYALDRYRSTEVVNIRMDQTMEGTTADTLRMELFPESMRIGLEHPFFGASPQWLPVFLRERIDNDSDYLDSHNVVAHLIGGCGFTTFLAFVGLFWTLWRRPLHLRPNGARDSARGFHNLLRMMLLLFLVRGMFTREVLYNPCFAIGLGIILGRCIDLRKGAWRRLDVARGHDVSREVPVPAGPPMT